MAENNKIVETKTTKTKEGPLEFLKKINDWLETVPLRVINAFENFIGNGEHILQEKVDAICVWLAWKVNIQIERVRQKVIKTLWGMYQKTVMGKVMKAATATKEFVSDPIGSIGDIASVLFGPFKPIIEWVKVAMKEIPRLARNLAKIASAIPPTPPNPRINYDKFKIQVKTISFSMITSDPSNMPPPEVIFPEPPKPFSKETFENVFTSTSAKLKSNQIVYKLTNKQKQSLNILSGSPSDIDPLDNLTFNV